MGLHACIIRSFSYLIQDNELMHEKKNHLCFYFVMLFYLSICNYFVFFRLSFCYDFFPISGSTVETTTTIDSTTTETTSSLGVTITNTTITTTEKMLIVNTGENGSDTNNIANTDDAVPTITETDNTNNNNY